MVGRLVSDMELVCKRLPATENTLKFISDFMLKEHIRDAIDERWKTPYGIYDLFISIRMGGVRCYGVFELDGERNVTRFCGFEFGWLDQTGETFESHVLCDRGVDAAESTKLCMKVCRDEFLNEGTELKSFVGYIPDFNRAARLMALRIGFDDCGIREDKRFMKNKNTIPCREYRLNLR